MARKDPPVHQPERNQLRETGLYTPRISDPPRKPKKRLSSKSGIALIAAAIWVLFAGGIVFSYWLSDLPDTRNLLAYEPGNDISVLDAKGRMIARRGLTQGEKVAMGELPVYVGNAFIAVEDRRFRYHFGIDPMGLIRAAYADLNLWSEQTGGRGPDQRLLLYVRSYGLRFPIWKCRRAAPDARCGPRFRPPPFRRFKSSTSSGGWEAKQIVPTRLRRGDCRFACQSPLHEAVRNLQCC